MFRIVSILVAACVATSAWAVEVGERVENFRLLAHTGDSHELYYYDNLEAVVFLVQGNGCPIVRNAAPRFAELRDEFADQNVKFFMLNSNLQDNRATITKEANEFGYDIPILMDDTQIIGESLDLVRTGEVFVVDPKTWKVAYRGALDDRLTYENQKKEASAHYLRDA
ncbi:MAG: redoxin family protein, partial [Pseudomonadales bacterium]|nr:redoxin family protein [Pseudomonadales bacterium]